MGSCFGVRTKASLQRLLGHQSLAMTMRYAHLAPEHLKEAKARNPLAQLRGESS